MKFGVGYWSMAQTRLRPRHHSLLYDELIRDAQTAESLGYEDYWLVEHHFWYDGHCNAELTALGALAAETNRIGLGTSCLLLPLHDPLRVAEMAGTVNQLCDGRLQLTVGLGYREEEFDGLGISRTQRVPRLEESIGLIRELWAADKPFTHTGKTFTYHDVESRPRPGKAPSFYLGGFVPKTAERAARLGCGLQLGPMITAEQGQQIVQAYHETAAAAGVDTSGATIGILRDFWVSPTMEEAREVGRKRLFHYYGETVGMGWKFVDEQGHSIGIDQTDLLSGFASFCVDAGIIGDVPHVTGELQKLRDAGFNYVQLRMRFDSQPGEVIRDEMALFAEEVMPALAD